MQLGVVFPQMEIGSDPSAVREYLQAVEEMGYQHVELFDHVLGADPEGHPGWQGQYTHKDAFHEPLVFMAFVAAVAPRLGVATGILVLPQRQTALVAKQAAEVDILSGGRLRLGVGSGWNAVEYEALGQDFHTRGRRIEEQIDVLRLLWTRESVTYQGRWHQITAAGINPPPVQRPIPIWMGGGAEAVVRRVARMADGWIPGIRPDDQGRAVIARMHGYAREAGRDPKSIGIEARINVVRGTPEEWVRRVTAWQALGATYLTLNNIGSGLASLDQHLQALRRFKETAQGGLFP
ncbi:MAG: LLM class F420-dependent oxidoreductase [Dehalococcoidia bacterium]|nr:LLM class F420-dependent oxidoreductase [Dehalococcoidia bacterium]